MFEKIIQTFTILAMLTMVTIVSSNQETKVNEPIIKKIESVKLQEYIGSSPDYIEVRTVTKNDVNRISDADIDLLCLVTMAEAEGETERGKRLVISTILNRLDSEYFPDTIEEVIYQPGSFTCTSNGRIDRCCVKDDIRQLVMEELNTRTNSDVIFFRSGEYSEYGDPMFVEGGHYFSSYN